MKIFKKVLWVMMAASLFTSCEKILDVEPKQDIEASTAIENETDVVALVVGAYSVMGGGELYGTNLMLIPDLLGSDDVATWRGTFVSPRHIANKVMLRDNADANLTWTAAYRAINIANIALENLNLVTTPGLRNEIEGEALFIRGIMHFELVRLFALPWGATPTNNHLGVVIKTVSTKDEAGAFEKIPRSTVAQVYAQVLTDLTAAANLMPEDNGKRANRYAALGFLSRVYLAQLNYAGALAAANEVIESGRYEMNASVTTVFTNDNTGESVWEIQQNEQNNAGTSNNGMATFHASLPGIGRGDVRVTPSFVANNYPAGDNRATDWYYIGTGARPGNTYTFKWNSFSQNLPIIRIAEMYLTRAEANLVLGSAVGDTPGNDLAQIRNLVRTNSVAPLLPTLGQVRAERFIELAFEGHRIHDLRRLRMNTGSYAWNADELVMPIPQREVDATGGILIQNPGY